MRLTDTAVRALAAPPKGSKVYYDDTLKGFGVRVSYAGTRAFILAVGDNRDRTTIGRYPIVGLAEARQIAKNLLAERQLGRHQTPKTTLGAALDLFTEQHIAQLAPRTQKELERLFARYLSRLHTRKLAEVTTQDITKITDKAAPSEAEHLHRACKTFFRWCVRRRILQHSPLEGLELPSNWKARERVLTDDELKAVWVATEKPAPFNDMIRLCILTGQRRGELSKVQPAWIANNTLTIPATLTKNRKRHSLPLGQLTKTLLIRCPFSFNSWSKSKAQLDKASGVTDWVIHDLRRGYATTLHRLGIRTEVVEALLNHISGSKAGIQGVYNRHRYEAEMREAVTLFEDWFEKTIA